ncbi:MAG: lytic transglycosylase domain-containing protein [Calditrichaeota bacterium]|nr:MAG: lytic transglycosylase domain-containing protein [Calditrichota bacterium]
MVRGLNREASLSKSTKYVIYVVIYFMVISGIVLYSMKTAKYVAAKSREIEKVVKEYRAFLLVDSLRTKNIQKVITIINHFNPDMPEKQKYQIAMEIYEASIKYDNLDVDLICATITHESAFTWDPKVVSPKGAMGLMQIMPSTGRFLAEIEGVKWTRPEDVLFDPVVNIRLGSRYLSSLIELYEIDGGLAAYNGGGKQVHVWLANNKNNDYLYLETQRYVPAVLSLYQEFRNWVN